MILTDGGVYDNLGLETAWKAYETILVSDGGGGGSDEPKPKREWLEHVYRVLNLLDSQVRSLRKRQVIGSYQLGLRKGRTGESAFGSAGFRKSPVGMIGVLILRENYSDHSVVDRVTGRYPNISSFKGCAAGEILGISHSVPCATVGYTLRADYFGHKLPTRKNRAA